MESNTDLGSPDRLSRRACLSAAGTAAFSPALERAGSPFPSGKSVNPMDYGASGDGKADDTEAVQASINAAVKEKRALHFPSGLFRITRTLRVPPGPRFAIRGEGSGSVLMQGFDDTLLSWGSDSVARHVSVFDLGIASTGAKKTATTPAMKFPAGLTFGTFRNLIFDGSESRLGSGIVIEGITAHVCLY